MTATTDLSFEAKQIAAEADQHFQSACSDIAYGEENSPHKSEDFRKWAKKARAAGCTDLAGAYADYLYNDADTIEGFVADKVFDLCCKHPKAVQEALRKAVWDVLAGYGDGYAEAASRR